VVDGAVVGGEDATVTVVGTVAAVVDGWLTWRVVATGAGAGLRMREIPAVAATAVTAPRALSIDRLETGSVVTET